MRPIRTILAVPAVLPLIFGAVVVPRADAATSALPGGSPSAAAAPRPIVFVHGFFGSGSQFETQAKRFAANGYPAEYVEFQEYDSTYFNNSKDDIFRALDARIARLRALTGSGQVDLAGHSMGTALSQEYLNSSPNRAATVARYVNIDGATASSPPGGVPTLAIWGEGNDGKNVSGATNVHLPGESHVETTTSVATFKAMYPFLTGLQPQTTEVVPEPGAVRLAGRAVSFPSNVGVKDARLDIFTIDPATGARTSSRPVATYALAGDGSWGPFWGSGSARYEFQLAKNGTDQKHHLYFEPFRRTDLGIRLLSTDPRTGIDLLIERNKAHVALLAYRNKEWWGDQGASGDTLTINGTDVLNAETAPRGKRAIGLFAFDSGSDKKSDPSKGLDLLKALPFITGVDLFLPAATSPSGTVTIESRQRGGGGHVSRMVLPNWPSDTNAVTVTFDDHVPGRPAAVG